MKKRKQILSIILAAAMISGTLVGCGQEGKAENVGSQASEQNEVSTKDSVSEENSSQNEVIELEEATIQLWLMGPGKQKDSDAVYEAFNEKLQEYVPNTTVEFFIAPASEYGEQFKQMLAAGEEVDLAWVGYATTLTKDAIDGNLMALDELIEEYGTGIQEALGDDVIDIHRFYHDGKLYYLPSWQGLVANRRAYYVPTEFAEIAGETWAEDTQKAVTKWVNNYESTEDLKNVLDQWDVFLGALKDNDKLYSGLNDFFCGYWTPYNINEWIESPVHIGVQRGDDTYTVVDTVDTDYFKTFASYMSDFYKKGYWRSDIASIEWQSIKFVENGEYNDNTTPVHCHNAYTQDEVDSREKTAGVDLTAIFMEDQPTFAKGNATGMAIPYCADEPERAMMVLDAIYSVPELYQLIVYGIEGEHYTKNSDGTITTPYGASPTAESDYGTNKWVIGTCMNSLVTQADVSGYYDRLKEAENTALVNPFINFIFDRNSVSAQVAAVAAVDNEYIYSLTHGYAADDWEEIYEKYVAERKAAGSDEIIAEVQRQLNEYIAANNIQ